MKKRLLVLLFSLASLALVSCGGGNDVASSGATAVSTAASATTTTSTASAPSTTTATEPKVNGQIDERTGVASVAARATLCCTAEQYSQKFGGGPSPPNPWTVYSNGGCGKSSTWVGSGGGSGSGPALNVNQQNACTTALNNYPGWPPQLCEAMGGTPVFQTCVYYCAGC